MNAPHHHHTNPTRREFIARTAKALAALAATGFAAYRFRDAQGPRPCVAVAETALPDFSIPGLGARMSIASGADREHTLARALEALGGIGTFVRPGDRVLIKVNAAFATPPILCATTHPQLLAAVIRACRAAGAASVTVTDNPINDPSSCFVLTGLAAAAQAEGATVIVPSEDDFRPFSLPGGSLIRDWPILAGPLLNANKLIGLAPVKDHNRSGASMTLKNWYGLLGGRRNVFHQDVHTLITELALMIRPTFVVLDGTMAMMTNGPTGGSISDLKATNTMIVSTDPVAADAFGATLLGREPANIPYITKAAAAGAGTANFELLNPARV